MEESDFSMLNTKPDANNELKEYLINYTGTAKDPDDENVTLEMIIDVLSENFPELVLCLSEENWIRGYNQALTDVEEGEKLFYQEQNEKLHKK